MKVNILATSLIACICEGGAETVIMDILLDEDLLIFNRKQLIDENVLPRTSVKEFFRFGMRKPSEYCKSVLKMSNVKSPTFIKKYFSDSNFLVKSIIEYQRIHKQKNNEATLFDLLKK